MMMKKQILLFLVLIMLPMVVSAQDIEVKNADGITIYYNYFNNGTELEVTFRGSEYDSYSNEYSGNVVIPEEVTYMNRTRKVTSIGGYAFYRCSKLTSISIPNSVTSIGEGAFEGCSGLTSVTIGNSVTSIGDDAFYNCSGLTSVTIGNSVTSIGDHAFYYCSGLTSVTIGNSVTSIGDDAFYNCSGLTSVTIPNSVTSIGSKAFYKCTGLTSVTIGSGVTGVTSIGESAFQGCSGLTSVTIGNSVTSIGNDAFRDCSSLKKVIVKDIAAWCGIKFSYDSSNPLYYARHIYSDENTEITNLIIPNSVTNIGDLAFYNCSGLTSVTIGNSVTSIGEYAFNGCKSLTSVTIPNSVTSIGSSAFYYCTGLTSITIPNSVTSIGSWAFYNCSGLTSVTIPNSVTSIGWYAFYKCTGLTSVTIPNSVTSIGACAFDEADISTVISLIENPFAIRSKTDDDYRTFSQNTFMNATLYVPVGTIEKYKATTGWKDFVFMEEGEGPGGDTPQPPTPEPQKCEKPTISYENGKLTFSSATDGAVCQYSITDMDIKAGSGNEVQLSVTYTISVYAAKSGYENSETATATLCWIDQQPKTEGITNGIANIPANAVLIQSEGGSIKVQGVDEGTQVNVYGINGTQAGSAVSQAGAATINTNLQPGSIAIVKIGQKSVKVVVK